MYFRFLGLSYSASENEIISFIVIIEQHLTNRKLRLYRQIYSCPPRRHGGL